MQSNSTQSDSAAISVRAGSHPPQETITQSSEVINTNAKKSNIPGPGSALPIPDGQNTLDRKHRAKNAAAKKVPRQHSDAAPNTTQTGPDPALANFTNVAHHTSNPAVMGKKFFSDHEELDDVDKGVSAPPVSEAHSITGML